MPQRKTYKTGRYGTIKEANERPESADGARRRTNQANTDWFTSEIYQYIHHARLNNSMKVSSTTKDSSMVGALTKIEKDEEKADMKYLFRLIDLDSKQQQKLNILSA